MPKTTDKTARKHLRSGRWITERKRFAIYWRDNCECQYCGTDLSSELGMGTVVLDHVDGDGGNEPANLVTACKRCNDSKSGAKFEDWVKDTAVIARVNSARLKPIDEEAGQRLFERTKGVSAAVDLPSFPRLTVEQAAILVQMSPAEIEARVKQKEIVQTAEGIDPVELFRRALTVAKRVTQLAGEKSEMLARKLESEAKSAEIKAAKDAGELAPKGSAKAFVADMVVKHRQCIERADYIPAVAKKRLFRELAEIKPGREE